MKKKIDIITLSCARNYGAMLQTYALYAYLKKKGNDVCVIDYITERYNLDAADYVERAIGSHKIFGKNILTKFIWKQTYYRAEKKARLVFRTFLTENVELSKTYYSNEEMKEEKADIYISGSDQIWNTDFSWDKKIDLPYFLDFAHDNSCRLSYASSFGKKELNEYEKEDVFQHLRKYQRLGVRENSAKEILDKLGLYSEVVCDPTLLLDKEEWMEIGHSKVSDEKYAVLFQIKPNKKLVRFAKKFAKDNGYKLYIICPDWMHIIKIKGLAIFVPSVEEWVSFMSKASFIITDSFHATVFATIFEKQFYVSLSAGYNSRIVDYLNVLGIKGRILSNDIMDNCIMDHTTIDYSDVRYKRNAFIECSKTWIADAISNVI